MEENNKDFIPEKEKPQSNEDQMNKPSAEESIASPESFPEADQPITDKPQPLTEQEMEVHHSHAGHEKKNWKSYFWEFLMLFLAVFCGFLAEYQLEHVIERNREKQFVESFIEDLKTDTASIRTILDFRHAKMNQMDSLMLMINTQQIKGHENEFYFFGRTLVRSLWFRSNDRTITQLKNSGSLRLIRNELAADSMMSYQKLVEMIMTNQEDDRIERRLADNLLSQIYNPFVFDEMVKTNGVNRPVGNPPLRSYDPKLQVDLAYYAHQLKGSNFIIQGRLGLLNEKAKNIITFLQKEYHLR